MLTCMDHELQKRFERSSTQFIIGSLEVLYKKQARTEHFEITKALIECMEEGSSMSEHIVKLDGYVDRLASLEFGIPPTLGIDIVLASLPHSYDGFIMNYNMNGMEKSANELFAMLKSTEVGMQKNKQVLMVNKTASFKKKGKSKKKSTGAGTTVSQKRNKDRATKEIVCFYCKQKGH
jgi:hypothetical protein